VESSSGSGTLIRRRGSAKSATATDAAQVEATNEPPYWSFTEIEEAIPESENDIVLTAAHVVADARDVRVQLHSRNGISHDKYVARVMAIAHDCDLALLEVSDSRCFEDVEPVKLFGPKELLDVQSRVQVIGFPIGGDYLSITEGILSRVEVVEYSHSRRPGLALTVDAAINAGNSGGPVVDPVSGRMLAVAHQKVVATGVENQGHAVPPCLVWRFLYGQAHGKPARMPSLGAFMQSLESPAHRERLGLGEGETGVLIREVNHGPDEPLSLLQAGDVLLQVGPYRVDNFSAVELLGHRVALSAVQDLWFVGDQAHLRVRRDGEDIELEATLRPSTYLVPRSLYGGDVTMRLDYFVCGGLVFVPLTADFLEQAWPNAQDRPAHLMDLFYRTPVTADRSQAVVLLSILSDDVNAGHGSGYVGAPIADRISGEPVRDIMDLARKLCRAVDEEEFVNIDFTMSSGPYTVVLKSANVPEADERITELYMVPALTSLDLSEESVG